MDGMVGFHALKGTCVILRLYGLPVNRQFVYCITAVRRDIEGEVAGFAHLYVPGQADKSGAGLGISSVRAIAGKYGGMAGFEQKDGVFQASVLLYRKV